MFRITVWLNPELSRAKALDATRAWTSDALDAGAQAISKYNGSAISFTFLEATEATASFVKAVAFDVDSLRIHTQKID